jgi:hypothetical protein
MAEIRRSPAVPQVLTHGPRLPHGAAMNGLLAICWFCREFIR